MRWLGNYAFEWLRGPWPEMLFIRHGHGFHQIGYEMRDKGLAETPREALGVDIPNHLVPLSPLGRKQGEHTRLGIFSHEMSHWINPDCVYVSQIARAIETAQIIYPGRELKIDPRLNEKDFGATHMMGDQEYRDAFPYHAERYARDGKYFAGKGPGSENYIDMFMRLHSILDTLRRDWAGKKVAIVCHSAIMLTIRQLFERYSPEELMRVGREEWIENCGMLHYRRPGSMWGYSHGKFRVQLVRPPFHLWSLDDVALERHWQEAMDELESLRERFAA